MKIYKKTPDRNVSKYKMVDQKALDAEKKKYRLGIKAEDEEDVAMTLTETEVNNLKEFLSGEAEIEIVEDPLHTLTDEEVILLKDILPKLAELVGTTDEELEDELNDEVLEDDIVDEDLEDDEFLDDEFIDEDLEDEFAEDATSTKPEKEEPVEEQPEEKATDIAKPSKDRVWVKKKPATKAGDAAPEARPNAQMFNVKKRTNIVRNDDEVKSFNFHK